MRILAISGSLRAASSNTALLRSVANAMRAHAEMSLFAGLGTLPAFNPDCDESAPASVASFRAMVAAADCVALSTPEYAHGIPGVLKNALDWLVGSGELYRKPVALLHVSDRGEYAQASLREVLTIMGAKLVFEVVVVRQLPDGESPAASGKVSDLDATVNAILRRLAEEAQSTAEE
jgi:chromate reductase